MMTYHSDVSKLQSTLCLRKITHFVFSYNLAKVQQILTHFGLQDK